MNAWSLENVFFIIASLAGGLLFYYIATSARKSGKKKEREEIVSILINFILFVWAGKLLMNLPIFLSDPLAVLAYPSASPAFFTAVILMVVNVAYRVKRHAMDIHGFLTAFLPVFLGAAFSYEFLDIIWHGNHLSLWQQGLLLILMVAFMLLREKLAPVTMACMIFAGWSAGQLLLSFFLPFTSLFGYMMTVWFLLPVFITSIIVLIFNRRKVASCLQT
ncbi:hypothetical protein GCM10008983_03480 [Lentibacillus halophilus]|uniref:Uncharacterized protein n=1 Tax=Lentibacillus halophilus TaxID=295065 RepID=A0ABN0Z347_9BACI